MTVPKPDLHNHPPVGRWAPPEVAQWAPADQLRWFHQYWDQLTPPRGDLWGEFHVHSTEHKGTCCVSCISDQEGGYVGHYIDDPCCCNALREAE